MSDIPFVIGITHWIARQVYAHAKYGKTESRVLTKQMSLN